MLENGYAVLLGLILGLTILCDRDESPEVLAGPIINPSNQHIYYLLASSSWQAADSKARKLGGHLVTINNAEEQTWVETVFLRFRGEPRSLWIGLREKPEGNGYAWTNGDPVAFTHWLPFQPDRKDGKEKYIHMIRPNNGFGHPQGYWNDLASPETSFHEFDPIHGLVEVDDREE